MVSSVATIREKDTSGDSKEDIPPIRERRADHPREDTFRWMGSTRGVLDSGGYARYDFSTATTLLGNMKELKEKCGSLEELYRKSTSPGDLEKRLQESKSIGPVSVNIYLRELREIWQKARPKPSKIATDTAKQIGLESVECCQSSLVRLTLEYCRKDKCEECPARDYCPNGI